MTNNPDIFEQIAAVQRAIQRPKSELRPSRDYAQEARDEHDDGCLRAALATLQRCERLEAVAEAARVWFRCDCPMLTPRMPTEQDLVDSLTALDAAAAQTDVKE